MVRWGHLPRPIKDAIRRAGFRPRCKECFTNCQRVVLFGDLPAAEYYEGIVRIGSGTLIAHAWLVVEGAIVDITLTDATPVRGWTISREDIAKAWGQGKAGAIRLDELDRLEVSMRIEEVTEALRSAREGRR